MNNELLILTNWFLEGTFFLILLGMYAHNKPLKIKNEWEILQSDRTN